MKRSYFACFLIQQFLYSSLASDDTCNTIDCKEVLGSDAACVGGTCVSNPYYKGCLHNEVPGWTKKRICNSDDPEDAESKGVCRNSDLDYMEISVRAGNWDSATYQSWILQILLSEILDIPTTIDTGIYGQKANFYDPSSSIDYGLGRIFEEFAQARKVVDCRKQPEPDSPDNYTACIHVDLENWAVEDNLDTVSEMIADEIIEPPQAYGIIGSEGWYIPSFTAQRDPSLLSYFGMQGEENRQKLAERFLTPMTWMDYCNVVSIDNCTTDDGVASRPPQSDKENNRLFFDGAFTGHFYKAKDNDCNISPTNCTGHFADYPCGWSSYAFAQQYHHGISLENNMYSYRHLSDIWHAANATKSDVIMYYWSPETLVEKFAGTDAAFTRVSLPEVTEECVTNRVKKNDRCGDDFEKKVGEYVGACDDESLLLHFVVSSVLKEQAFDPNVNEAIRSPAYFVTELFQMSNIDLSSMIANVNSETSPREGVCKWVANNLSRMKAFAPATHPRVMKEAPVNKPILYSSISLATITIVSVLFTFWAIFQKRDHAAVKYAQLDFLYMLLAGCLLIAVGSLLLAIPPSDMSCPVSEWFITLGYTLEMMPLLVKVAAINYMMNAGTRMTKVRMKKGHLYKVVFGISAVCVVLLLVWTVLDPPRTYKEYSFDEYEEPSDNEPMLAQWTVYVDYYCESSNPSWAFAAVSWHALMLLVATVLAFQSRSVKQDFNETRELILLIYSNFFFVILRLITYFLSGSTSERMLAMFRSLIYSLDTIASLVIYFAPKLLKQDSPRSRSRVSVYSGRGSGRESGSQLALADMIVIAKIAASKIFSVQEEDLTEFSKLLEDLGKQEMNSKGKLASSQNTSEASS